MNDNGLGEHREAVGRAMCAALGVDPERDRCDCDGVTLMVVVHEGERLNWQHYASQIERLMRRGLIG